ncbi:unnamed protein product [Rhizophagus irregularis]|nr:unnamed protein product [Rhizophagus irregularis]
MKTTRKRGACYSCQKCFACNSQIQRHRSADKKKVALNNLSNEKDAENDDKVGDHQTISLVSSDIYEEEDIDNVEVEDEVKVQIIVKSKNIKVPIAKTTLNIEPTSYKNAMEKLHNKSSDESGFSSAEELQYTKKKKLRAICEEDLSNEEKTRPEVISTLCEIYRCNVHATPCFIIQDNWHLQLDPARLQLWAQEIINKEATYEVPPSYLTFDVKSSMSNLILQTQVSQTLPTTSTTIIIQLPSQFYPNCTFQDQLTSI